MLKITKKVRERWPRELNLADKSGEMEEHLSLLNAEDRAAVDRVTREVDSKIVEAARESVKELKMLEEGRCPACSQKTRRFLFNSICEHCGWSGYARPLRAKIIVHLRDASTLICEDLFHTPEELMCVTQDVVRYRIPRNMMSYIEFDHSDEEIKQRREQLSREEYGQCSWCLKPVTRTEEETRVTFAAFAIHQERYLYCCIHCQQAFQKQYPTRIHRDCYNRECAKCGECQKRYEDTSYETFLEEEFVH
jgi:hypothetical protein